MAGLIADLEGGLDDAGLAASEKCLAARLANSERSDWPLSDSEKRSLTAVVNEHDRQLRETRLKNLAKATEHLERSLKDVGALEGIFGARRAKTTRSGRFSGHAFTLSDLPRRGPMFSVHCGSPSPKVARLELKQTDPDFPPVKFSPLLRRKT